MEKQEISAKLKELKIKIDREIFSIFSAQDPNSKLKISQKEDRTVVTYLDQFVSDLFRDQFMPLFKGFSFYSEEEKQEKLKFPSIVLDPIDGTKEFSQGIPECSVSLAILFSPELSDPDNFAWIYNPLTGFSLSSLDLIRTQHNFQRKKILSGLVSSSEYQKKLFEDFEQNPKLSLIPVGSIAFKLGLLAAGACDFVISKQPKNLWDIAGGTLLSQQRGISFFSQKNKLDSLEDEYYQPELLWTREENLKDLD